MKKNLLLTLLVSAFLSACDDEETKINDSTAPEISVSSGLDADFIQDVISIQATASDNVGVTSMEVLMDDKVISMASGSAIDVDVDTRDYEEGSHKIKIVAKDEEGNEGVFETSVNVMNYFITLNFRYNNPYSDTDYWFYVVDDNGQVVDTKKVSAADEGIRFSTPANHHAEKLYSLVQFQHVDGSHLDDNRFNIVTGYTQGTYVASVGYVVGSETSDVHVIEVKDCEFPTTIMTHSGDVGQILFYTDNPFVEVPLGANETYFAVRPVKGAVPVYSFLQNLEPGQTSTISPSELLQFEHIAIPIAESAWGGGAWIGGIEIAGDPNSQRPLWFDDLVLSGMEPTHLHLYYPGSIFPEYYSSLTEVLPGFSNSYFSVLKTPPSMFKRIAADVKSVNLLNNVFTIESQGTYDCLILSGRVNDLGSTGTNYFWSVILPNHDVISYKLPSVPEELIAEYGIRPTSEWNLGIGTSIEDYSGVNGFEEFFDETYAKAPMEFVTNSWTLHSNECLVRQRSFDTTSGRSINTSVNDQKIDKRFMPGPFFK